ncbi:hypothetical protein DFP72DRAFT_861268 [Ephemerocybe angulata]|uniref:Uncharacterized protein n=1 Tax=Ephemerocybe angulata TaxID=980116 RepID=A0A8H6H7S7_9AGAR|nr:hypothetical protein DFP72DRAFT_861268 [Tulosesus angulatus]
MKFTSTLAVASFLTAVSVSAAPLPTTYDAEVEVRELVDVAVDDLLERYYDEEIDEREFSEELDELFERSGSAKGFAKDAFTTIAPAVAKMGAGYDSSRRPNSITRPIAFNNRPAPAPRPRPAPVRWQGKRELSDEDELLGRSSGAKGFAKDAFTTIAPAVAKMGAGYDSSRRPNSITRPIAFNNRPAPAPRPRPAPVKWQGKRELSDEDELFERSGGAKGFAKDAFTTIAPAVVKMGASYDSSRRPNSITRPLGFNNRPAPAAPRTRPAPLKWQGKRELSDEDELLERSSGAKGFAKDAFTTIAPAVAKMGAGYDSSRRPNSITRPIAFNNRPAPAPRPRPAPLKWQGKRELSSELDELD